MLKFAQLQSCVDVTFWSELADQKLDRFKLSEAPVSIRGHFVANRFTEVPSQLAIDGYCFESEDSSQHTLRRDVHQVPGTLLNLNTLESFKSSDKQALLRLAASRVWSDILTGAAESNPSCLVPFVLLVHGDLKHFHFHYWVALPALKPPVPFTASSLSYPAYGHNEASSASGGSGSASAQAPASTLSSALGPSAAAHVAAACDAWRGLGLEPSLQATPLSLSTSSPGAAAAEGAAQQQQQTQAEGASCPFWLVVPKCAAAGASTAGDTAGTRPESLADAFADGAQALPISRWHEITGRMDAAQAGSGDGSTPVLCAAPDASAASAPASGNAGAPAVLVAMSDPSNLEGVPGWPLRNFLLMAAVRWRVTQLVVVCVRDTRGRCDASRSLLLQVHLPPVPPGWCGVGAGTGAGTGAASSADVTQEVEEVEEVEEVAAGVGVGSDAAAVPLEQQPQVPDAVGWEPNLQGKLVPRFLDLSPHMSPQALAEQAVDLNLRLMRWRAAPDLDVGRMATQRCLLLGAGTLGCVVARTLQAWGVRHITLLDNSRVSFSNPVRQSLYCFEDCLGGGKPKAAAAAASLKRVFPSCEASGVDMAIPMPGHPPAGEAAEAAMKQTAEALDALVQQHDALFLLTDTRESRWLPALLAAAHGKIAITAAVGFDSFLVMRHGAPPGSTNQPQTQPPQQQQDMCEASPSSPSSSSQAPHPCHSRLGCYFCNDVVAPLNSTRDRSLDQQCTVARPGLAHVAGALAAELLAALVQHPAGVSAPPPPSSSSSSAAAASSGLSAAGSSPTTTPLGSIPHMVRGHMATWSQVVMEGRAFSQCTACSPAVVETYRSGGWEFLLQAIREPRMLEELTGLTRLHEGVDVGGLWEGSDDDDVGNGGDGGDDEAKDKVKDVLPGGDMGKGPAGGNREADEDDWTSL